MDTPPNTLADVPLGLSESELARRLGKSVGYVAARRREGVVTPLCRLGNGQLVFHPSALAVLAAALGTTTTTTTDFTL